MQPDERNVDPQGPIILGHPRHVACHLPSGMRSTAFCNSCRPAIHKKGSLRIFGSFPGFRHAHGTKQARQRTFRSATAVRTLYFKTATGTVQPNRTCQASQATPTVSPEHSEQLDDVKNSRQSSPEIPTHMQPRLSIRHRQYAGCSKANSQTLPRVKDLGFRV